MILYASAAMALEVFIGDAAAVKTLEHNFGRCIRDPSVQATIACKHRHAHTYKQVQLTRGVSDAVGSSECTNRAKETLRALWPEGLRMVQPEGPNLPDSDLPKPHSGCCPY
jgi:hypothetical protein